MKIQHTGLALTLLLLAGCANLAPKTAPATITVDELRAQHRYISALKLLATHEKSSPDYKTQHDDLVAEARRYQSELLHQIDELARQQHYAQAQMLLQAAQPELPESRELEQFSAQFYAARDHYVQRYLDELAAVRGNVLLREEPLYQALENAAADPELKNLVARHQADVDYFAPLLANIGAQALVQNDYARAQQYLAIANQLTPSPQLAQQLKRAEQGIAANKQKQQTVRSVEREQKYRDAIAAFQQSLQLPDYLAAREQLEQVKNIGVHADEVEVAQRQLDSAIGIFVAQEIDAGNRLYADGHIEEALQHWRKAEALTSSPELKERIDKAQRFIDRLQQLRNRPKQ